MSHPRIGRASEERVAQRSKSLEILDVNPIRGEVALTDAERTALEQEKQAMLQRLGVRAPAAEPTPAVGEVEQEHKTVAVSPEDATEVVGELAGHATAAEIQQMVRDELAQSEAASTAAAGSKQRPRRVRPVRSTLA